MLLLIPIDIISNVVSHFLSLKYLLRLGIVNKFLFELLLKAINAFSYTSLTIKKNNINIILNCDSRYYYYVNTIYINSDINTCSSDINSLFTWRKIFFELFK